MISATGNDSFFKQLETQGGHLAQERARTIVQSLRNADHRWRSAATLWPTYGLE